MKKLFVILLLVALVPFTTGCNGLWDFDSDDDNYVAPTAKTNVVLNTSATIPAALVNTTNASLRAQQNWKDIFITIGTEKFYPVTYTVSGTDVVLNYTITKTKAELETLTGTAFDANGSLSVPFVLEVQGQKFNGTTTVSNVSSAATATNATALKITSTSGVYSMTVTYTLPTSSVAATGTSTGTVSETALSDSFYVESIVFGTKALGIANDSNIVEVNTINPTFNVVFNSTIGTTLNKTWSVKVTNVTSSNYFTLTNTADAGLFTVTPGTKSVAIKVGSATGKALKAGQVYKVEVISNDLKNASGTTSLAAVAPRFFKTAAAPAAATTLNSVTSTIASGTGKQLTLTFSAAVKNAPEVGSEVVIAKTGGSTVTLTYSATTTDISFSTSTVATTTPVLTINKAITAGTYTVSVTKGAWLDSNSNPVEVTTKTFTVTE